jgi:hypothetical protein
VALAHRSGGSIQSVYALWKMVMSVQSLFYEAFSHLSGVSIQEKDIKNEKIKEKAPQ